MSGEGYLAKERSLIEGIGRGDLKIAYGAHTNVAASDTVVTGLSTLIMVVASLNDDPAAAANAGLVSADIGDQAGTPAAGSFLLKSWEIDATVATAFGDVVNWIAIGY